MILRPAFGIALFLVIAQPRTWTFAELLSPPSAEELRLVDDGWARKAWDVGGAKRVGTGAVPIGSYRFDAFLYSFNLNGSSRCGAVLVPPMPPAGGLRVLSTSATFAGTTRIAI